MPSSTFRKGSPRAIWATFPKELFPFGIRQVSVPPMLNKFPVEIVVVASLYMLVVYLLLWLAQRTGRVPRS